jgi:hypothetical protein
MGVVLIRLALSSINLAISGKSGAVRLRRFALARLPRCQALVAWYDSLQRSALRLLLLLLPMYVRVCVRARVGVC